MTTGLKGVSPTINVPSGALASVGQSKSPTFTPVTWQGSSSSSSGSGQSFSRASFVASAPPTINTGATKVGSVDAATKAKADANRVARNQILGR